MQKNMKRGVAKNMYYVYLDAEGKAVLSPVRIVNQILLYSAPIKSAAETYIRRARFEIQTEKEKG